MGKGAIKEQHGDGGEKLMGCFQGCGVCEKNEWGKNELPPWTGGGELDMNKPQLTKIKKMVR